MATHIHRFQLRTPDGGVRSMPVPNSFYKILTGPMPPDYFISNGCSLSPDKWRGRWLFYACHIHDFHYGEENPLTGTWAGRREADRILYQNLFALLRIQKTPTWEAMAVAHLYWGRVRIWGAGPFSWSPEELPLGFFTRVREAYGRFPDLRPVIL